jgi:hypothetical protein
MFKRALRLGTPEFVGWNLNLAETVGFNTKFGHRPSPGRLGCIEPRAAAWLATE